ncbi:MAG: FAD-dependent oxidoreductase [Deltaproteobacteria bacterium]|nr:MAG: FAD-dependent oxidoreductase [Deltaproteobacteria bacterium]
MPLYNVVIIGAGPAGCTAALYTSRAFLSPLVFSGELPNISGGQLMLTSEVENFPGFPSGIIGEKLMLLLKTQASKFGTIFIEKNVENINLKSYPFEIKYKDNIVQSKSIILAMGSESKMLGLPYEKELIKNGGGVSVCATCDGAFYKNRKVAVVGGGDSAMEEAIFLTKFANSVLIINRNKTFKASKTMLQRAQSNTKISFELEEEVKSLLVEKDILSGLQLKNKCIPIEGLFIAIGHNPKTDLVKGQLPLDDNGYIITLKKSSNTIIPGVFACGDIQDPVYKQAIVASGSGCQAAMDCEKFLNT